MPLPSYRVLSPVYIAPPPFVKVIPKKIAPEDIKSNKLDEPGHARPNVTSYPWGEYKPDFIQIDNKVYTVTRTANKRYLTLVDDFLQNGPITQNDDYGIESWKSAGEDNYPNRHNWIPKMPDIAYITGITPAPMNLDIGSTPVNLLTTRRIVEAVDPNKIGLFESKNSNNYLLLRRLMWGDANRHQYEAVAWIDFLEKKGFSIETSKDAEIISLGIKVDVGNKGYLAAYHPTLGYLATYADFHNKVKQLMAHYGLTEPEAIEAMKRADMLHELAHRLGINGDRASEKLQGELRAEFYSTLAENFKGTKWERIYKALAQEGRDYARDFSFTNTILDEISAELYPKRKGPLELLIAKFLAEADALEVEERARTDYVTRRLEEIYGPLLGTEPSFVGKKSSSKSENKKYSSRKKGLEALIETLRKEAKEKGRDEGEYISDKLGRSSIKYIEGENEADGLTYEKTLDKSEYKNMNDVKERGAKAEKAERESPKEVETSASE